MHQMAVNVKHGRAVVFSVDDVFVPDFVVERAGVRSGAWHLGLGLRSDFSRAASVHAWPPRLP